MRRSGSSAVRDHFALEGQVLGERRHRTASPEGCGLGERGEHRACSDHPPAVALVCVPLLRGLPEGVRSRTPRSPSREAALLWSDGEDVLLHRDAVLALGDADSRGRVAVGASGVEERTAPGMSHESHPLFYLHQRHPPREGCSAEPLGPEGGGTPLRG